MATGDNWTGLPKTDFDGERRWEACARIWGVISVNK